MSSVPDIHTSKMNCWKMARASAPNIELSYCRCEGRDFFFTGRQESPGDIFSQEVLHLDGSNLFWSPLRFGCA